MAKILLWATFFLSQETVCVHLGILLQSHIESYSPHLLPYKPEVKVVVYYQLIVGYIFVAYSLGYFCNPTLKVTPPTYCLIRWYTTFSVSGL